jgi:F-type H+-transporting ATPase subunit delta
MSVERIAARYAKSLIELSLDQSKLERVKDDMAYFQEAVEVRDLTLMLRSPIIHGATKRKVFEKLFKDKFDELTMAFLDIILRKGREFYLADIADAFMDQYRVIKQISRITLTTAVQLSDERLEEIKQQVRGVTTPNIEVKQIIDPEIVGGFILAFGDRLYDASVSHKLEEMRKGFLRNSYEPINKS